MHAHVHSFVAKRSVTHMPSVLHAVHVEQITPKPELVLAARGCAGVIALAYADSGAQE